MDEATIDDRESESYRAVMTALYESTIPFMIGGAFALREYTGIARRTKDLDIFCLPGDYEGILRALADAGFETSVVDANWLAKARDKSTYIDIIFNSANNQCRVDQDWFKNAREIEFLGCTTLLTPAEELIWTKLYVQDRDRFDGADVLHMILRCGSALDWSRLLQRMDLHWEVLLAHLLTFRFVYPSERECVPEWIYTRLLERAASQNALSTPQDRICRGPLLSRTQYLVDVKDWGYEWGFKQS